MKTSTFILAASAALVAAQDIKPFIPVCSHKCLQDAAASASTCKLEPLDGKCICEPATLEKISGAAVSCVIAACGQEVAIGMYFTYPLRFPSRFCSYNTSWGSLTDRDKPNRPQAKSSPAPRSTASPSLPAAARAVAA
ncbi:hypothetical protein MAPG_00159, partial [Magnaporthiopsis poae ATCC 64411]